MKIEAMIMQSYLRCSGYVTHQDISSQICEIVELEITRKRKKSLPRKKQEQCIKKDLEQYNLRREDAYDQEKWQDLVKAKIAKPYQPG